MRGKSLGLLIVVACTLGTWHGLAAEVDAFAASQPEVSHFELGKVFQASPVIYSILLALSIGALSLWAYSLLTLRLDDMMPREFTHSVRQLIAEKQFESALALCHENDNFCSSILASGIAARKHGPQVMLGVVQSEGRRRANSLWQRISLLNEVAVVAPMLGLLGTVLGLFFAFYDSGHSSESLAAIFDGLGVAVGTTVAGLIVAIMAMVCCTSLKFRVLRLLDTVENEALSLVNLVEEDEAEA